jgi:hypothetical protein
MVKDTYVEDIIKNFKLLISKGDTSISNKSTSYLLPMLGNRLTDFKSEYFPTCQFRSLFIGDKSHNSFKDNKLLLLYRFSGKENIDNYIGKYDPDKLHTIYVYDIPDKWKDDFNKFINWKPSQFSKEYKDRLESFYSLTNNSPLYKTIHKKEDRFIELESKIGVKIPRDQEAASIPYWEIEYYCKDFKVINKLKDNNEW